MISHYTQFLLKKKHEKKKIQIIDKTWLFEIIDIIIKLYRSIKKKMQQQTTVEKKNSTCYTHIVHTKNFSLNNKKPWKIA